MTKKLIVTTLLSTIMAMFCRAQSNIFPNSGNVGIGTTSPTSELDVIGRIQANISIRALNPNNNLASLSLGWLNDVARIRIGGNGTGAFNGLDIQSIGDVSLLRILGNGNVGIGTTTPADRLSVNGNIRAKEIKVEAANWPDYVFQEDYSLRPLESLENYIQENGHLPGIPTAQNVANEGVALAEMNRKLLEKVEELTLYVIELNETNREIKKKNELLEKRIDGLENHHATK